jgi:hypothetical protein
MNNIPRDVIHQETFVEQLHQIENNHHRADEFIRGVEWQLSKDPTSGDRITNLVWAITFNNPPNSESLVLYYTFNENNIWFLSIR